MSELMKRKLRVDRPYARVVSAACCIALLLLTGCATVVDSQSAKPTDVSLSVPAATAAELAAAQKVGITPAELDALRAKPLFRMKPEEVGRYISYLQLAVPNLRERVLALGRKNIGQPYEIYLLGEFPYEVVDDQPLFNLAKSDCVVYAEHTYAMALSGSWPEFFWMLQRIRYRDGVIGVTTRNHYTETDWNPQNAWLVTDITELLGGTTTARYPLSVDREKFFRSRYQLDVSMAVEKTEQTFIPTSSIAAILPQLQAGDLVNVISTRNGGYWASHVGLIGIGSNGERTFLHSAEPAVREESFDAYIARAEARAAKNAAAGKPVTSLAGFKFLRLNDTPNPPPMAPQPRPVGMR